MARVTFVKKAQKDYPAHGIEKGESYYWWKFRHGSKHFSKTRPRPSQLTQSDYLSSAYALQEQIEDLQYSPDIMEDVPGDLRNVADELRTLGSEQEDKICNMPDSLQDSEVAERLRARAEACEEIAGELESAADEIEDLDVEEDENLYGVVADIISAISWDLDP